MYRREARAQEIIDWLIENGVDPESINLDKLVEKMQNKFGILIDSMTAT